MKIGKVINYGFEWYLNPARKRKTLAKPVILNWPITENCNSRCLMCDVWKTTLKNELNANDWKSIFSDPLFTEIKYIGISGGEPTLRSDLADLVEVALESFPKIEVLTITTHGFLSSRWEKHIKPIKKLVEAKNIAFTVNISLDGIGGKHNEIRNIPKGFEKVEKTISVLKKENINLQIQTTILSQNVYHIGKIQNYLDENHLHNSIFRLGVEIARLDNEESMKPVQLNVNEASFFADYIGNYLQQNCGGSPARKLFYSDLQSRLINNTERKAPCFFQNEGVLLTSMGDMYHCSISTEKLGNTLTESPSEIYFSAKSRIIREQLIMETCPKCLHDQSGAWTPIQLSKMMLKSTKLNSILVNFKKLCTFLWNILSTLPLIIGTYKKKQS